MGTTETAIRPATQLDLAAIVEMSEARRVQYQEYQPVFWRKAEDSAPVYDPGGATCQIDGFCVSDPGLWPSVGRVLLKKARSVLEQAGAAQVVVVCGDADRPTGTCFGLRN